MGCHQEARIATFERLISGLKIETEAGRRLVEEQGTPDRMPNGTTHELCSLSDRIRDEPLRFAVRAPEQQLSFTVPVRVSEVVEEYQRRRSDVWDSGIWTKVRIHTSLDDKTARWDLLIGDSVYTSGWFPDGWRNSSPLRVRVLLTIQWDMALADRIPSDPKGAWLPKGLLLLLWTHRQFAITACAQR